MARSASDGGVGSGAVPLRGGLLRRGEGADAKGIAAGADRGGRRILGVRRWREAAEVGAGEAAQGELSGNWRGVDFSYETRSSNSSSSSSSSGSISSSGNRKGKKIV